MSGFGYVYLTTNLLDGTVYVGQRVGEFTWNYFGSGRDLVFALKSFGLSNFKAEVLEWAENQEQLNTLEKQYIALLRDTGVRMYNILSGGHGGTLGHRHTEETKAHLSEVHTGMKASEATRQRMSQLRKGKTHSPEHIRKRTEARNRTLASRKNPNQ